MLNPAQAERTLGELVARIEQGDLEPIEATLEVDADADPAAVAALEASFTSVGLALLRGVDVHTEQLASLWDEQLRLLLEIPGELPSGRLLFGGRDRASDSSALLGRGLFFLAALAISEQLPRGTARAHPLLRPWLESSPPRALGGIYDELWNVLDDPGAPWFSHAYQLVDRLRETLGTVGSRAHRLELPGVVLDEIQHDVLDFPLLSELRSQRHGLRAMLELAQVRGLDRGHLLSIIWNSWDRDGRPEQGREIFDTTSALGLEFWANVPTALLKELFASEHAVSTLGFSAFRAEQWEVFAELCSQRSALWSVPTPWRCIPGDVLERVLDEGAWPSSATPGLVEAWRRFPKLVLGAVKRNFDAGEAEPAWGLVDASPPEQTEALVTWLRQRVSVLDLDEQALSRVRGWLARTIQRRDPGWRRCYAYLHEIEQGLAPLKRGL